MKMLLPGLLLFFLFFSCKKQTNGSEEKAADFFISFKIDGSSHVYKVGNQYTWDNEGTVNSNFGYPYNLYFHARTSILPLPYNANKKLVGFSFYLSVPQCPAPCTLTVQTAEVGRTIFQKGEKFLGFTGYGAESPAPYEIYYPGGVAVFWLGAANKYFSSTSGVQPQGSYFIIDDVTEESFGVENSLYTYEKIISGRFKCRVYNPSDKSMYTDLDSGSFRMPVWRKQY